MASLAQRLAAGLSILASVLYMCLLLALAVGSYLCFRPPDYQPGAARYLPPDTEGAVVLNLRHAVSRAAVVAHLLPLADRVGVGKAGRLRRLRDQSGWDPEIQLREVVFGWGPGKSWVVVLGGLAPKGDLIASVQRFLAREGFEPTRKSQALVLPSGVALGSPNPGRLVVASSLPRLEAAWPPSLAARALGLSDQAAASVAVRAAIVHQLVPPQAKKPKPKDTSAMERYLAVNALKSVERAAAQLPMRGPARARLVLDFSDPQRQAELVKGMRRLSPLADRPPVVATIYRALGLGDWALAASDPGRLTLEQPLSREALDRAVRALAVELSERTGIPAARPVR